MTKRKIILNLCTSLDSFIEGINWEIDWCFTDQDYGMTEFLEWIDTILFWRKSYELLMKEKEPLFSDKNHVVFSKTLKNEKVQIIRDNIEQEVLKMINLPWKNIWLFGWASLFSTLLELKLVDELIISIHPLILWNGKSLFINSDDRLKLKLTDTRTYNTWLVQVRYAVEM